MFRSTGLGLGRVLLWLPLSLAAALLAALPVLAQTPVYANVAYASPSSLDTQKLDIYHPTGFGAGPYPVMMLMDGGGTSGGGREVFLGGANGAPITAAILARGWAVAAISYRRLTPMWPVDLNDCKAAVRFLRANAGTYNLNASAIVAWGKSGGGRLASLLATTAGISLYDGSVGPHTGTSSAVAGAVVMFAPLDWTTIYADDNTAGCAHSASTAQILGCTPDGATYSACLPTATEASAALQVNAGSAPVLSMSALDYCGFRFEHYRLMDNLAAVGAPSAAVMLATGAHGDPPYYTYYAWNYVIRFLCAQGIPSGCTRTFQ